ncbi:MAG: DUF7424 family protein [Pseudomonadota bacterium]
MIRSLTLPAFLLALIVGLTGCKASIEAEIDVSTLHERPTVPLFVTSKVEVDGCERVVGGSERPGSLDRTQWTLSGVFPDTRYSGCVERESAARASFRNMVVIDGAPEDEIRGQSHVNLLVTEEALRIAIPDYVQGNIERVRDQTGEVDAPAITVTIELVNDSDAAFEYRPITGFDGDRPRFAEAVFLNAGERGVVELPESFAERVLAGETLTALRFSISG